MRRVFIVAVFLLALVIFIASIGYLLPAQPKSTSDKFNVILISVDSVRADHMSLYGYGKQTTPRIDAWAEDAVVFDNYFATAFLTPISEASVHTGDYPFTSGVINFESQLRSTVPTLAQVLQKNGWQTGAFLSSPEFFINAALKASFERGFDTYTQTASDTFYGRGADPAKEAAAWIEGQNREPFFLWLGLGSAHWPYGQDEPNHFSDPSYIGLFKQGDTASGLVWHDVYGFVYQNARYSTSTPIRAVGRVGQKDFDYLNGRYDDGLVLTDRLVGGLFEYLDKTGLADRTIVIFESEHGETLGERGYVAHYDIYDETVHTPLVIKIPTLAGRRVGALVSGVDVMPTILSLLRVSAPAMDGVDISPYLTGATSTPPREEVFLSRTPLWERVLSSDLQRSNGKIFPSASSASSSAWAQFIAADDAAHYYDTAIRTDKWKLIHRLARTALLKYSWWGWLTGKPVVLPEYELYDLAADLGEMHNIYSIHNNDLEIISLQKKLAVWEAQMKEELPGPTPQSEEIQPYF